MAQSCQRLLNVTEKEWSWAATKDLVFSRCYNVPPLF